MEGLLSTIDSFQCVPAVDPSNGLPDFTDFSQFGLSGDNVHIAGGVEFEIPPLPVSPDGENFHIVGGVPFEIPPLPDFDFDDMESMNNFIETVPALIEGNIVFPAFPTTTTIAAVTGASTSSEDRAQSEAVPPTSATSSSQYSLPGGSGLGISSQSSSAWDSGTTSDQRLDWGANFSADFAETVPIDAGGVKEGGKDHLSPGEFGEFSGFPITATAVATVVAPVPGGVVVWEEDFGGFSSHTAASGSGGLGSCPPLPTAAEVVGTSENSLTTAAGGFNSLGGVNSVGDNEFGEFSSKTAATKPGGNEFSVPSGDSVTTASTLTTATEGYDEFGGFSSNSAATTIAGGGFVAFTSNPVTTASTGGGSKKEFCENPATKVSGGNDDFGTFSSNPAKSGGDDFGEFGFSTNPRATTTTATTTGGGDDFGEFGGFSSSRDGQADVSFSSASIQKVSVSGQAGSVSAISNAKKIAEVRGGYAVDLC